MEGKSYMCDTNFLLAAFCICILYLAPSYIKPKVTESITFACKDIDLLDLGYDKRGGGGS